jgi:hypothetical protein
MKYNFDGKKGPQISFKLPGERRERVTVKAGETVEIEDRFVYAFERSKQAKNLGLVPASEDDAKRLKVLMDGGKPSPKPGGVTLEDFERERERRFEIQDQLRELEENVRKNGARAADEEVAALQAKLKESQNAQAWLSEELAKVRAEAAETKALVAELSARLPAPDKPKGK